MESQWIVATLRLPPKGVKVETKTHDRNGESNKRVLEYHDGRWMSGALAMYYTPTHWRFIGQ